MAFRRFAIFHVPPAEADWARFATRWLGWDMIAGSAVTHPDMSGLPVDRLTEAPRRYGLHATLKPPFRLARGKDRAGLEDAVAALAARQAPATIPALDLVRMGRFLALCPTGGAAPADRLAAACVRKTDLFHAPPDDAELACRRASGLSPRQQENLDHWGYPHVMDMFRFHITLTGRLPVGALAAAETALGERLVPLLPAPYILYDIALAGEDADGRFHLIRRFPLTG